MSREQERTTVDVGHSGGESTNATGGQTAMLDTPIISAPTAQGYRAALKMLAEKARDCGDDIYDLARLAHRVDDERRKHNLQPRQKMTRTEVQHNALRRFCDAIGEAEEFEHLDGGSLGLRVWEAFEDAVRSAAATAERYGPNDTTWAPEDDSNPFRTCPVPTPDPGRAVGSFHEGDWVRPRRNPRAIYADEASYFKPRQILAGPDEEHDAARLSDTKDGSFFGGYFVPLSMLADYELAEAPNA